MKNLIKTTKIFLFLFFVLSIHSYVSTVNAYKVDECLECHQKEMVIHSFEETCLTCHNNDMTSLNITKTITSENEEINTNCQECHNDKFKEVKQNEHGKPGLDCQDCHEPHPTGTNIESLSWEETIPIEESTNLCKSCHPVLYRSWKEKTHGDSDLDCTSCHDPHEAPNQKIASIPSTPQLKLSLLTLALVGFVLLEFLTHKIIYKSAQE